jgi:hypothetical protein
VVVRSTAGPPELCTTGCLASGLGWFGAPCDIERVVRVGVAGASCCDRHHAGMRSKIRVSASRYCGLEQRPLNLMPQDGNTRLRSERRS